MSKKMVTLGEIMLRLSTPCFKRFVQADSLDVTFGGSEANVAAALCNYGLQGVFVSKVPDNAFGQSAINHLRRYGVDTQYIARGGNRLGIYFLETGASVRASQVLYDREGSSIAKAESDDFNFDNILEGASWFHTSGITPALSDKAAALTELALKAAREKGITTSIDVNYREKLWSREKAAKVMTRLCRYADVCIGADPLLGDTVHTKFNLQKDDYKSLFKQLTEKFGFTCITATIRESYSASDNRLSALAYNGTEFYDTRRYDMRIVDRVGGGDAFAAGIIYGLATGMMMQDTAEFAVAASALKHTIPGDQNHSTINEIKELMKGDADTRVKR